METFQQQLASDEELPASLSVVNNEELQRKYELALGRTIPTIDYELPLEKSRYLSTSIAGTNVVLAAVPLKDCIRIPGIRDGTLFWKNVRQFMGAR